MTVVNPKSISGINSITTGSGSDNLLTIHTSDASSTERVRINSSGDVIVGSGITASPDGNIFATGVTTSTTFVGALTGNVTGNVTGNISGGTVAGSTGTFSGAVSGTTGTFSSHVSLGDGDELRIGDGSDLKLYHTAGTANYIQASGGHANIHISNLHQLKNQANDEFMLTATNGGSVALYHDNSKKFETTSSGATLTGDLYATSRLLVNTTDAGESNGDEATFANTGGNAGITIRSAVDAETKIYFSEGTSGGSQYRGAINYNHNTNYMAFSANETEKMRILSGGGITFNGDTATANALDDYEEGSWSVTSFNYDYDGNQAQRGHYVKIGRIVHAFFRVKFHNQSNYLGQHLRFTGLPFTAASGNPYDLNVMGLGHGYGSIDFFRIYIQPGSTYAYWYTSTGSNFNNSTSLNNADVRGCITYTAAS